MKVAIFGTGAQGRGHAATVESVVGAGEASISFVGRSELCDLGYPGLAAGSADTRGAVAAADLVVYATTARDPILSLSDVRPAALIIAVGPHTTGARELASDLMGAAHVMVEDVDAALREAGDVTLAIAEGALSSEDLIPMKDVVAGAVKLERDRPIVFKTVGMPWEDLVVADAVDRA